MEQQLSNLTESQQEYHPIAEARQRMMDARDKWLEAEKKNDENPSTAMEIYAARMHVRYLEAEKFFDEVRSIWEPKHLSGRSDQ